MIVSIFGYRIYTVPNPRVYRLAEEVICSKNDSLFCSVLQICFATKMLLFGLRNISDRLQGAAYFCRQKVMLSTIWRS